MYIITNMRILSLQEGHGSTVGMLIDGEIVALVSQERFDYIKNSEKFPKDAIKELLGHSSLAATQIYTHNSIEKLKITYNKSHPRN